MQETPWGDQGRNGSACDNQMKQQGKQQIRRNVRIMAYRGVCPSPKERKMVASRL